MLQGNKIALFPYIKDISRLLNPFERFRVLPKNDEFQAERVKRAGQSEGNNPLSIKGKIQEGWSKIKGVKRDPLVYLGVISILLFGGVFMTPTFFSSHQLGGSLPLPSYTPEFFSNKITENQLLFLGPNLNVFQSPDMYLVNDTAIKGVHSPLVISTQTLGVLVGDFEGVVLDSRKEILEYLVQDGDTLGSIAEKFGISLDTVLWANSLSKNSKVKSDQRLIILPVSGTLHEVRSGETLSSIAKKYKAKSSEIIAFNNLTGEQDIQVGDIFVVPDGVMPVQQTAVPLSDSWAPLASSYFIWPIAAPYRLTQGLHFPNAVDMSHGKCGDSIFAAAGGEVTRVRYGYNNGAGNYVRIMHPNGVTTDYGHLLTIFVNVGDKVSQGQLIALMGGQPGTPGAGKSTGCHLHFSVAGARNPFAE